MAHSTEGLVSSYLNFIISLRLSLIGVVPVSLIEQLCSRELLNIEVHQEQRLFGSLCSAAHVFLPSAALEL